MPDPKDTPEARGSLRSRRPLSSGQERATCLIVGPGCVLEERYEIEAELGPGGTLFRAMDRRLGVPVAIQVLPPELSNDRRAVTALKREAASAMRLRHPAIVALADFCDQEPHRFMVLELLEGGTLDVRLKEAGALPLDEVVGMARVLGEALDYAHGEGVVHRDIRPGHVFLERRRDGTCRPKLTNFGTARRSMDLQARISGTDATGPLCYSSPEQLRGDAVDARADVYSLAATLYECLSGEPPVGAGSTAEQIEHETVRPIPGLPDPANAALLKALARVPGERFASAGEFARALAGEPVVAAARVPPSTAAGPAPASAGAAVRAAPIAAAPVAAAPVAATSASVPLPWIGAGLLVLAALVAVLTPRGPAQPVPVPTFVSPALPALTPVTAASLEPVAMPTQTPTPEPTPSPTPTPAPTPEPTPSPTPTPTPTPQPTPSPTPTPAPTPEPTPSPTPTPAPTPEPTPSPTPASASTPTPLPTVRPAATPPSVKPRVRPSPTRTPAPTPASTPAPAPTSEATLETTSTPEVAEGALVRCVLRVEVTLAKDQKVKGVNLRMFSILHPTQQMVEQPLTFDPKGKTDTMRPYQRAYKMAPGRYLATFTVRAERVKGIAPVPIRLEPRKETIEVPEAPGVQPHVAVTTIDISNER